MLHNITLYDKSNINELEIPQTKDAKYLVNYFVPMLKDGITKYIKNIDTDLKILKVGNVLLPININTTEYNNSYTSSIYTHYVSYAIEELRELKNPVLESIIKIILKMLGCIYKIGRINKVVYVNNWFLSTNLYPSITVQNFKDITVFLQQKYPEHAIVFRSLNKSLYRSYIDTLSGLGYKMFASRQIYLFHKNRKSELFGKVRQKLNKDIKLLKNTDYAITTTFSSQQTGRLVNLYDQLYLDKYSVYNPQFSEDFFNLARENKLFNFQIFYKDKAIDAVLGYFERNNVITTPIYGYDMGIPRDTGLYRMLSAKIILEAEKYGYTINMSSGASLFKLFRGCVADIEFSAILYAHLPFYRKLVYRLLLLILNKIALPLLKSNQL